MCVCVCVCVLHGSVWNPEFHALRIRQSERFSKKAD